MAEKRMFTKKITDDDNFLTLSSSAQALYFHLNMSADDDGFCNQISSSMFKAHASVQDLEALLSKRFVYQFESGVIVIKHWRMANALRKDRYKPTAFQEELKMLGVKENEAYTLNETWLPNGCQTVAIDKNRLDKNSIEESDIYTCVSDILGKDLSNADMQILRAWEKEYKEVEILEALREAISNNAKYPISYTDKLLKEKNKPTGSDWLDNFNKEMRGKGL